MPWHKVEGHSDCPTSKPWAVVKDDGGEVVGCHTTEEEATDQLAALNAQEGQRMNESILRRLWQRIRDAFEEAGITRAWDGSPSRWPDTDSYCKSCLIDVNSAAGRDEKAQSHCKLPVKNPGSDAYDFEGIQAAAGALSGARGGISKPDDVPQDAWDSAVKSAANTVIGQYNANDETAPDGVYEAAGKEAPEDRALGMGRLYGLVDTALYGGDYDWPWLIEIYLEDGSLYALTAEDGKLFRYSLAVDSANETVTLGERTQVMEVHQPVGQRSSTQVFRLADGRYRFLGIAATSILNRVGEIDSRDLFDSFVAHAEETGRYPLYQFYHQGQKLRLGQVDYLAREGNVYIFSGLYDDPDENPLARGAIRVDQEESEYWGNSIGYEPTLPAEMVEVAEGVNIPVYRAGVNGEISKLPEADAAALFTRTASQQEVNRMNPKVKEALERLLAGDQEALEQFGDLVDRVNERAEGRITREAETPPAEQEPPHETDDSPLQGGVAAPQEVIELDDAAVEAIARQVAESESWTGLDERLTRIEGALEELSRTVGLVKTGTERQISELGERLKPLERDKEEERQQWLDDLPALPVSMARLVYKPREANAKTNGDGERDLSSVANDTLAMMD